jgi:hypothetical protein
MVNCYDPIGETHNLEETWELYNNPENHWKPFREEDELKWHVHVKPQ